MSKKYYPSGYQIIELIVKSGEDAENLSINTEDRKILLDLLKDTVNHSHKKPVLIIFDDIETSGYNITGFAQWYDGKLQLNGVEQGGSCMISVKISTTDSKLQYAVIEYSLTEL